MYLSNFEFPLEKYFLLITLMKQDVKLSLCREDLPELGHREKTPSSFPLKIEYLMLSRIELGAKAFTVMTEVPVKMR